MRKRGKRGKCQTTPITVVDKAVANECVQKQKEELLVKLETTLAEGEKIFQDYLSVVPNVVDLKVIKGRVEASGIHVVRKYLVSEYRVDSICNTCLTIGMFEADLKVLSAEDMKSLSDELMTELESTTDGFRRTLTDRAINHNFLFKEHQKKLNEIFEQFQSVPPLLQPPESADGGDDGKKFIPTPDPITKTFIIEPVKKEICGHFYGKESILYFIRNHARVRFPGCSKLFLQKNNSVRNAELSHTIAAKVIKAQKRKDTTRQF